MPLIQKLDLDGLTFGALYRFADLARSAGVGETDLVTVVRTDELGNDLGAHTLVADLGDVDDLTRPVLVDGRDAPIFATSLARELAQDSDSSDREPLERLLASLRGQSYD